jgi:uncharacterized protein
MMIPDVNLLVYAVDRDSPFHQPARVWLEEALNGTETVGFAWNVVLGFLRLTTRSAVMPNPITIDQSLDLIAAWLAQPPAAIIEPGERHLTLLRDLLSRAGTAGNLTSDAHLAAIALEHGAEVCSTDNDFSRFAELRWRNPLPRR